MVSHVTQYPNTWVKFLSLAIYEIEIYLIYLRVKKEHFKAEYSNCQLVTPNCM